MVSSVVTKRSLVLLLVVLVLLVPSLSVGGTEPQAGGPPYVVEHSAVGYISCAAAYQVLRTTDFCRGFDPNSRTTFDLPLDPQVTTLVVRVDVTPGVFGADEFFVTIAQPIGPPAVGGPVPIQFEHHVDEENAWPNWSEPGQTLAIDVRPNHEADLPQVAYQQKIELCVGLFYNDAKVPDGYVPCAEG